MEDLTVEELQEFGLEGRWRRIRGYEEFYLVSETGEVFSIRRAKKLKARKRSDGYLFVTLYANGKRKMETVHRLVAKSFLLNPENKPQVNHIDCDKRNNRVENLEWVTQRENMRHAYENNLIKYKLTESNVREILELISQGKTQKEIAQKFGVSTITISRIKQGIKWSHVTGITHKKHRRVANS